MSKETLPLSPSDVGTEKLQRSRPRTPSDDMVDELKKRMDDSIENPVIEGFGPGNLKDSVMPSAETRRKFIKSLKRE